MFRFPEKSSVHATSINVQWPASCRGLGLGLILFSGYRCRLSMEKRELNNLDISALNELREFVHELTNVSLENLDRAMLFGPYAKRTYRKDSGIDVAVIVKRKSNDEELVIADVIGRLGRRFGKEIQAHHYTSEESGRIKGKDRRAGDIAKDGIRLM